MFVSSGFPVSRITVARVIRISVVCRLSSKPAAFPMMVKAALAADHWWSRLAKCKLTSASAIKRSVSQTLLAIGCKSRSSLVNRIRLHVLETVISSFVGRSLVEAVNDGLAERFLLWCQLFGNWHICHGNSATRAGARGLGPTGASFFKTVTPSMNFYPLRLRQF